MMAEENMKRHDSVRAGPCAQPQIDVKIAALIGRTGTQREA